MRPLLILLVVIGALLAGFWLLPSQVSEEQFAQRTDLPWQISALPDGTSTVLGLHLGVATLTDVIDAYGTPENIALFVQREGDRSLEVYFGTVHLGPLTGKLIATLAAEPELLDGIEARSVGREGTQEGAIKRLLADEDKANLGTRLVSGLSYVPSYGGLEAQFFRERLGEPDAWREETEHAVSWFYPTLGLSLLVDAKGKEVFEYVPPHSFALPADATLAPR